MATRDNPTTSLVVQLHFGDPEESGFLSLSVFASVTLKIFLQLSSFDLILSSINYTIKQGIFWTAYKCLR